jgi:hypothetical protein
MTFSAWFLTILQGAGVGVADAKPDAVALAAFMSGQYRSAGAVQRVPAPGNRVLLKRPLPPLLPERTAKSAAALVAIDDSELKAILNEALRSFAVQQAKIANIDRTITARRMDERFMNELVAKARDNPLSHFDELREFFGAFKEQTAADLAKEVGVEIAKFVVDFAHPTYQVGLAQKRRQEETEKLEAAFQDLWDRKLHPALDAAAGPAFDAPAVEVALSKFVEDFSGRSAVVWKGLVVKNVARRPLTNVALRLTFQGGGGDDLTRSYFIPAFKANESYALYVNDRAWGDGGRTAGDKLQVEVRLTCDEGKQDAQAFVLSAPTAKGHLARGKVEAALGPSADGGAEPRVNAGALVRALARENKSLTLQGGGKRVELRFSQPTEPLVNIANVVMVPVARYVRMTLVEPSQKKPLELDGHPEVAGTVVEILSQGNFNGAVTPNIRHIDPNHGTLTVEGGLITLKIQKKTYTTPVADLDVVVEAPKPGEGGVLRSRPGSSKSSSGTKREMPTKTGSSSKGKAKVPSLEGTWATTFRNASTADLTFTRDGKFSGTNGSSGTWKQTGRAIRVTTKGGKPLVWSGELGEDGDSFIATTPEGGRATGRRK